MDSIKESELAQANGSYKGFTWNPDNIEERTSLGVDEVNEKNAVYRPKNNK